MFKKHLGTSLKGASAQPQCTTEGCYVYLKINRKLTSFFFFSFLDGSRAVVRCYYTVPFARIGRFCRCSAPHE